MRQGTSWQALDISVSFGPNARVGMPWILASRGACHMNYRKEFAVPVSEDRLNCWGRVGKEELSMSQ